jgi:hypothetical protein
MQIKKFTNLCLVMVLLSLILVACQAPVEENSLQETAVIESAYPAEEVRIQKPPELETAYPIEEAPVEQTPELDAAYPITENDLQLLHKTWALSVYSEDGIVHEPKAKTLTFGADGSYEMVTESGSTAGNWTARLFASQSTLVLDDNAGKVLTFEIIDLDEALLNLRSWRENVQIDEQFSPAD